MDVTRPTVAVHGWFLGESSYVGSGTDVTAWADAASDEQLVQALGPLDPVDDTPYTRTVVRLPRAELDRWHESDIPEDFVFVGDDVFAPIELDHYELFAYIRANRPALRDRLKLCACEEAGESARVCHCDATVETAGGICASCENDDHNVEGRA
jgi:hypothetical protein